MTKGGYSQRMIVYSNVKDGQIVFHKLPVNEGRQKAWVHAVSKGKEDLNHFLEGKPNKCNPDPTLSLKIL